jgi:hypothetical protein
VAVDRDELLAAINEGRVTAVDLSAAFDDGFALDEDDRLRAVAHVMKSDPDQARPYFVRLSPNRLAEIINESKLEANLISLVIRLFPDCDRLDDAALSCPLTPESTLMLLAARAKGVRLSRLVKDELLLLLSPELARALERNPHLDPDQRSMLQAVTRRMAEEEQYKVRGEFRPEALPKADIEAFIEEQFDRSILQAETGTPPKAGAELSDTKKYRNIYARLLRMTAAEKALFAMRGNREVRMLLVRDSNRLVSQAVLRNPKLSDYDIAMITQMRDIDEEILRQLANNKRWLRKYNIVRNLVFNPRSPISIALSSINRMNNSDIRLASKERNLPSVVRQAAIRIAKLRGLR